MTGRERGGAELAGGIEEVVELHRLVAGDARHRRLAGDIALGELVDHRLPEALLIVEHVVRNRERFGHAPGVVDVLPGAARALPVGRRAMIVELQRDADDVVAGVLQKPGDDRRIDPARHRDDDAGSGRIAGKV